MKDPEVRPKRVCQPKYAVMKARKGKTLNRWELEDLARDPEQSLIYCQKVLNGRFPEAEPAIAQHPELAFDYAKSVIRGIFPAAEDTFLKHNADWGRRNYLERYFIDIAQEPNPNVEKKILATHHGLAGKYAERCIKGRWPAGEKVLLKDLDNAVQYHGDVVKERWPELEDKIVFQKKESHWDNKSKALASYLSTLGRRVPEIEEKLGKCNKASLLFTYAVKGVKGKLPAQLHQKMMMLGFDPKKQNIVKKYVRFLESCELRALTYIKGLDEESRKELFDKAGTN
jgi:hypothetical protein